MTLASSDLFGAGGAEPWSGVLRGGAAGLALVRDDGSPDEPLDVARWTASADDADRSALHGLEGPLLDIGCGPGRMVAAAIAAGIDAWGLDAESAAVDRCRATGLPVMRGDVFARLPREGAWASVLLVDGNIGIGGDVGALLARCRELLQPGGVVVAEADVDPARDAVAVCRVRDTDGRTSAPFRWSQAGTTAIVRAAAGFEPDGVWRAGGRCFIRLRRS